MKFSIDSTLLGTPRHLAVDEGGYMWVDEHPHDHWRLLGRMDDHRRSLDCLIALSGNSFSVFPDTRFTAPFEALNVPLHRVPWYKAMPSWAHRGFTVSLIDRINGYRNSLPIEYFEGTWWPQWNVVRTLKPAHVDRRALDAILSNDCENVSNLMSFIPDEDGSLSVPTYNRFGTVTGRLTVADGPGILTLKKEHRVILRPRRPGKIMMIDFKALEARVLLAEVTDDYDSIDLYERFAAEHSLSRDEAKATVLAKLYGSSTKTLVSKLNIDGKTATHLMKSIDAMFNTNPLLTRLHDQRKSSEFILNRFGRPVKVEHPADRILINYYAQSSGVDVSLLGFSTLVKSFAERELDVDPLFVLHDALIVDVGMDAIDEVSAITSVKIPTYDRPFPVKVETFH